MATLILSKILGLIRNRLLLHYFTPDETDIFFAAIQIPDFVFSLITFGALSVAFIPIFIEHYETKGKEDAFNMARAILNLSLLIFFGLGLIIFIFANQFASIISPGFSPEKQMEVAALMRVIIVGQIVLTVGTFFVGMLQSFQRFIFPALAGIFYNIGVILGIALFAQSLGIMAPAVGVVIGAFLHSLIQYPLIKSMGFRFSLRFIHSGVKEIMSLMSIRSLGLAAEQVNDKIGFMLASLLQSGSPTYLTLAQNLSVVPISLFGNTLAQAAFPVLSQEKARGRIEEFKITLLTTLHQILFLALPATAILIVIRIPVVRLVYGASQFNWEDTVLTGRTLAFLAIGLTAQAIALLLVRGFYALKDTKTPVVISLISVFLNIALNLYFIHTLKLDVWGIGLANSIAGILSGILLFWTLHLKVGKFNLKEVFVPLSKMLMASVIMGMALYIPIKLLDQVIFDTTRTINLIILTGISSTFALSVYIALVWYLRVTELSTYVNLIKHIWTRASKWSSDVKTEEIIHQTDSL